MFTSEGIFGMSPKIVIVILVVNGRGFDMEGVPTNILIRMEYLL